MVEIYSICGKWKQNDDPQWEFVADIERLGSLSQIDENVTFDDLVKMITEDLDVHDQDIALSYGFPWNMKCMIQNSPPVDIRNDRQLRAFIDKIKRNYELIPLCVTLSKKPGFSCVLPKFW
ncbi:hypothetical protein Bca4012_054909 [Brassica carinata]|uniref:Uncharacterized protein n=1 Tax=Brassica carinata TaxID=52824 RepID=A0A8X7S150_BRACI|nr:hypothetical protein Bca52824_044401 [Brassica carinata]